MSKTLELGLDTFGDVTVDRDGQPLSQAQTLRNVVAQGTLADQLGVDFIGVGEHHRPDLAVSAPEVVLAAIAGRTGRIRLGRLEDYEILFEEKLQLFARLLEEAPVHWSGRTRAPLAGQQAFPTTEGGLRAWVGVGGSPESVVRAARYGFPLVVAI